MKKILHIQLLPLLSGVQRVSLSEVLNLKDEYRYYFVCSKEGDLTEELKINDVLVEIIPELKRNISPKNDLIALMKLIKYIKKERFDIVHTHSSKTGVLGRIAAKIAGVGKVIHTVHGFSFPAAKTFLQKSIYFVMEYVAKFFTDYLIVLNETDRNIAIKKLHYNESKVKLIPNGVDIEAFSPARGRGGNAILKVVMVGRLSEQKDPLTFIRAAVEILKTNNNVQFYLIGDGELRIELEERAKEYADNIVFLGWKKSINEILNDFDVFVLPSLWEGMPLAILESLSCGLACIVTDIPGNADLVFHGYNGFLFDKRNDSLLSQLIMLYVNDRSLLLEHSRNSRLEAVTKYSLSKRCEEIKKIYC